MWALSSYSRLPLASTGHKDSVTCATFSHDSSLVATGDMGGLIKVWKVESKEEIWSFEVGDLEVKPQKKKERLSQQSVCLVCASGSIHCESLLGLKEFMRK